MSAARPGTRADVIAPTRPRSRRSSPSCATPATACTDIVCAGSSSLWRAGPCIHEALVLGEADLDRRHRLAARPARHGRPPPRGRHERVGPGTTPTLARHPPELPVGPLSCIVSGPTSGRAWSNTAVRARLRHVAAQAGVRRRFAPHQLDLAHAVERAREGVPLIVIQPSAGTRPRRDIDRPAGHRQREIIDTVHARRAPMIPVDASLRL